MRNIVSSAQLMLFLVRRQGRLSSLPVNGTFLSVVRPADRNAHPPQRNRMKITEALLAEHLVFHTMFDHIEASVPSLKTVGEIKSLAALLEAMLKTHADTEDQLFLGPLEHCFEQIGQRDSFLDEHQEMDHHLKLVQKATRLKDAQRRLLSAVTHSRRHFDREERIVFPMAEHAMKAQTLLELGENWIRQRTNLAVKPRSSAGSLPRSPSSQYQQSLP